MCTEHCIVSVYNIGTILRKVAFAQSIQLVLGSVYNCVCVCVCLYSDEYQYGWSLTSHPDGDQVGEMVGINTSKLKLSGVWFTTLSYNRQINMILFVRVVRYRLFKLCS